MKRVCKITFNHKYILTGGCFALAFITTFSINAMLKINQSFYPVSNSILSIFIFLGLFGLYKKIIPVLETRLTIISMIYGLFFSACMVVGTNVLLYDQTKLNQLNTWLYILAGTPLFMVIIVLLFRFIQKRQNALSIPKLDAFFARKLSIKKTFLISWLLIFLAWVPGLIAAYPGIYAYDSVYQLVYYTSGDIVLHYPLAHTYLLGFCVWTLGNLFGDLKLGLLVYSIFQMLCLSGTFALICAYMAKKRLQGIIRITVLLFFMFLPTNALMSFSATKDVLYTAFLAIMVLLFICIAEKPELMKKKSFMACLILFIFLQIIFRSQGIYVFIFGILFCFIFLRKYWKNILILTLCTLVLYGVYSGPVTSLLNGFKSDSIREMMSVPCVQLSKAYLDNGNELTAKEKEQIAAYIPNYTAYYDFESNSDALKNTFNSALFLEDPFAFINLWISVGIKSPITYIDAFARLTIGLWYPDMNYPDPEAWHPYWEYTSTQQINPDWTIVDRKTPAFMQWLSDWYYKLTYENSYQKIPVISMLFSSGFACWMLLLYTAWCIYIKKYRYLSAASFMIGVWLTTLLGPVVLYRYVYPIVVVNIVFIISVFSMTKREGVQNG